MRKPAKRTVKIQYQPKPSGQQEALKALFLALDEMRLNQDNMIRRNDNYEESA